MATSKRVAKIAGKELENKKTPKKYRSPIASALRDAKRKVKNTKSKKTSKK